MLKNVIPKIKEGLAIVTSSLDKTGTGFFINSDGYLVTCKHVIEDDTSQLIQNGTLYCEFNYEVLDFSLVEAHKTLDLCILKINLSKVPILKLDDSMDLIEGENIACSGYPFVSYKFINPTTTHGIVSAINSYNDHEMYQLDVMLHEGNSGGPCFLIENGSVVGIVTSRFDPFDAQKRKFEKETGMQTTFKVAGSSIHERTNISFVIPSIDILEFMEKIGLENI